ncbi:MAG: phosphoribosylanthranilate isomerase [Acidobacteriaceae bacterium]|nr:phosphoribosylanthranilate isomerase [Acidobacteriaceae bacterium]
MKEPGDIAFVVKVCGITNRDDAQVSVEAGANALGFNFYPKSPRYLSPDAAYEIARGLPDGVLRVGVFVNTTPEEVARIAARVPLDVMQLHGEIIPALPNRTWRAVFAGRDVPEGETTPEAYLLDSYTTAYGGSGKTFDWRLAAAYHGRLILAGGLDGTNVGQAIATARPWGVDASSRLELQPGKKDAERVRAFVSAALAAARTVSGIGQE